MADDFNFDFDELTRLLGGEKTGKKLDVMHEETEREIKRTRSRLAAEYKQAEKELKKKTDTYFKKYKEMDKQKQALVSSGKLSQAEYLTWRKNKLLTGERFKQQVDGMAQYLVNVDKQAADIVNKRLPGVYANNYNYARYEVEKGLHINTSFTLFDQKSVERLANKNPSLLPKTKINVPKDQKWSRRKINNAITQGILQGESLDKVAGRLSDVARMGWNTAVRNARTAMTGAQNAGRLDSYGDAKQMGIKIKKQWMATLDEHTRDSHADLDGQTVETDEPFITENGNELMYPGDPSGEPEEVYNCRCTMVSVLDGYSEDEDFERYDNVAGEPIDNVSYNEWARDKMGAEPAEQSYADRINAIKNDPSLSQTEKVEQAGQIFAGEMNDGYLAEMEKEQAALDEFKRKYVDTIANRWDMTDAERNMYEKYKDMRRGFREKYSQEKMSSEMARALSKVRSVGGKSEEELRRHLSVQRISDSSRSVMHAYNHYPTEWVDHSIARGGLKVKKTDRGYYSGWGREIAISGYNLDGMKETAFHELGHRFEDAVPGIGKEEKAFYSRRTAGEKLEWLGPGYEKDEVTRRDKFIHSYMGKDYGGSYYELVSMGFEYAYTNPAELAKDPDMQRWIYGMLCVL